MTEGTAIDDMRQKIPKSKSTYCFPSYPSIILIRIANESTAEIAWLISVAHAAPATPIPSDTTAMRSSTIFISDEKISRKSGISDFPRALKSEDRMLYMKRNGRPRKYI